MAGTVLKSAVLSSPSSQSTDVTAYFLYQNATTFTCSWKLKCTATAGDISCEATKTITITVPDDAGEIVNPTSGYRLYPASNTAEISGGQHLGICGSRGGMDFM